MWDGEGKVGEDQGFYTIVTSVTILTNGQVSATNLAWRTSLFFFFADPSIHTTPDL